MAGDMTGDMKTGKGERETTAPVVRRIAVIPVYNEVETLAAVFDHVFEHVEMMIAIDDGSNDGSLQCIDDWRRGRPGIHLLQHRKKRGDGRRPAERFPLRRKAPGRRDDQR
jgi:hypothetical protein